MTDPYFIIMTSLFFIFKGKAPPPGKVWQQPTQGKDPAPSSSHPTGAGKWQALPEWASDETIASTGGLGTFDSSGNFTSISNKVTGLPLRAGRSVQNRGISPTPLASWSVLKYTPPCLLHYGDLEFSSDACCIILSWW